MIITKTVGRRGIPLKNLPIRPIRHGKKKYR